MAAVSNPYSKPLTEDNATVTRTGSWQIAGIEVPVRVSEDHENSATVTKFAVESGTSLSDHIILEPITLTVEAQVPNSSGIGAARTVLEAFYDMIKKRQLVTVATEHVLYEGMALYSVAPSHTAPFKGSLNFTLKFQQVTQVGLQAVGRAPAGKVKRTAVTRRNNGDVQAKPVKKTALLKGLESTGAIKGS